MGKVIVLVGGTGILLSMAIGVFSRALLPQAFVWPEEVSRYLLIWCTFIGGSVALHNKNLVRFEFIINLRLKTDFGKATETDEVEDTVSYADIYAALKEEMELPSKLLEHVCGRIVKRLFRDFRKIREIEIKLAKRNPPMGADIDSAGVEMHCTRD